MHEKAIFSIEITEKREDKTGPVEVVGRTHHVQVARELPECADVVRLTAGVLEVTVWGVLLQRSLRSGG